MLKVRSWTFIFSFLMLTCAAASIAADTVWVTSETANLKAGAGSDSETLEVLPLGTELSVISTNESWYSVTAPSGKTGWIYEGKIGASKPEISDGGGGLGGVLPGSSVEASSADTSRSIRGLSPEAKQYAISTRSPEEYQRALDRILDRKTSAKEIENFLREGGIGEYGR